MLNWREKPHLVRTGGLYVCADSCTHVEVASCLTRFFAKWANAAPINEEIARSIRSVDSKAGRRALALLPADSHKSLDGSWIGIVDSERRNSLDWIEDASVWLHQQLGVPCAWYFLGNRNKYMELAESGVHGLELRPPKKWNDVFDFAKDFPHPFTYWENLLNGKAEIAVEQTTVLGFDNVVFPE